MRGHLGSLQGATGDRLDARAHFIDCRCDRDVVARHLLRCSRHAADLVARRIGVGRDLGRDRREFLGRSRQLRRGHADALDKRDVLASRLGMLRDVAGKLDDLERPTGEIEDRVVARLDPDLAIALGYTFELTCLKSAGPEVRPELPVLRTPSVRGIHEHRVVLAADFLEPIAQNLQDVRVGRKDCAVEVELDHRLGAVDGSALAFGFQLRQLGPHRRFRLAGLQARQGKPDKVRQRTQQRGRIGPGP